MYKKVGKLNTADAAYLAGLIDGEGTITLTHKRKGANRYLGITISSTEKNMLDWTKKITGVGVVTNKKASKPHHSHSYTYQVYSRQAIDIIEQIIEHLKSYKKKRAKFALKYYLKLTPRNGKYTKELLQKRQQFIDSFFDIKANL